MNVARYAFGHRVTGKAGTDYRENETLSVVNQ